MNSDLIEPFSDQSICNQRKCKHRLITEKKSRMESIIDSRRQQENYREKSVMSACYASYRLKRSGPMVMQQ